jgi:hypothetical protein
MGWIAVVNFISRWILFLAVAYKAYQTKDKGWTLLATAFFITALDVETYILNPLGLRVLPGLEDITSITHVIIETLLILWAVFHLKFRSTKFHHVLMFSVLVVVSYLWIFLLAVGAMNGSFALRYSFPMLSYGGTLLYLAYTLWEFVIGKRPWDRLFPIGVAIVGILNLTYPFTRPIEWFADLAFFTAAIGRLLAALGALSFVFYPARSQKSSPSKGRLSIPPGAYIVPSPQEFKRLYQSGEGVIGVTRLPPDKIPEKFPRGSVVFWPTKAKEGILADNGIRIVAISPTKLGILQDLIAKELKNGLRTVYIDAIEYLKTEVGFQNTLKFILAVKDFVLQNKGAMFIHFSEGAFDESEVKMIKREFKELRRDRASP